MSHQIRVGLVPSRLWSPSHWKDASFMEDGRGGGNDEAKATRPVVATDTGVEEAGGGHLFRCSESEMLPPPPRRPDLLSGGSDPRIPPGTGGLGRAGSPSWLSALCPGMLELPGERGSPSPFPARENHRQGPRGLHGPNSLEPGSLGPWKPGSRNYAASEGRRRDTRRRGRKGG